MPTGVYTRTTFHSLRISEGVRGKNLRRRQSVKSCGKQHAWCGRCRSGIRPIRKTPHGVNCQCPWHTGMAGEKNPAWKGGPKYRWSGVGWKAARREIWERDKVCQLCGGAPLPNRKLDVHHIIERRDGGTNELYNLIGYHHGCHTKVHRHGVLA